MKSLKAQISALLISMNQDYLTLMNITLFNEVTYKFMDPTSSQYVVLALVRAWMVHGNKFLWELLIFKKLWFSAQEQNWIKQKFLQKVLSLAQYWISQSHMPNHGQLLRYYTNTYRNTV